MTDTAPEPGPTEVDRVRGSNRGITLITQLRPLGPAWLRIQFLATRLVPALQGLAPFKSVHFTHWSIVSSFAWNGRPQVRERPARPWLVWETVYSAEVVPYIESFVAGIRPQIKNTWGTSVGFPGVDSVARLHDYINDLSWPAGHFYWAHPTASVRTVLSALEVATEHRYLMEVAATGCPEEFAVVYRGFLERRGADL
jgi:hypothetical protein